MYIQWSIYLYTILLGICNGARILGIFPTPGYSQYLLGSALMKALASKGHHVIMISPFQQDSKIENYEEIVLKGVRDIYKGQNHFELDSISTYSYIVRAYEYLGITFTPKIFEDPDVQKLITSKAHFDLVICEHFFNEAHMGFAHHFKAPLILVSSIGISDWTNYLLGNPISYAVNPIAFSAHSDTMTFKQRLRNTLYGLFEIAYRHFFYLPQQNQILKKYFPNSSDLSQLIYNASLIFLNSHPAVSSGSALVPNMIEIGGFHIVTNNSELSTDIKNFLDEARDGAIYFSMGTNLNANKETDQISKRILECFSSLNQSVLWKWKELPNVPKNVKILKWFSQQDILAHPNIRLFISHGGLHSVIEAIHYGVPIVGIPIFGDQKMNVAIAASKGYGVHLPLKSLSTRTLCDAINETLTNPNYRREAHRRSQALKDQPMKPLERAIFWVEYVIRNKGAPYLRSSSLDYNWFQYYLVDIVLCIILMICVSVLLSILLLKLLFAKKKGRKTVKKE